MNHAIQKAAVLGLALMIGVSLAGGCKDDHDHAHDPKPAPGTQPAGGHSHAGHDHSHHGHAHAHGPTDPNAAIPHHPLGKQPIGGLEVTATQLGVVEAGGPASFEIELPANAKAPKDMHAWVGAADGAGSPKAEAEKKEGFYEVDLQLPATLPADSKLWIEIETEAGTHKAGFALKR